MNATQTKLTMMAIIADSVACGILFSYDPIWAIVGWAACTACALYIIK